MKVSTQALKYVNEHYKSAGDPARAGVDALVYKIGSQLGAVEETTDFGARYEPVVVVKVVRCERHEGSDHLNICWIDDGGKVKDVERNEEGLVQVVCGAHNVRAGITVAWLPPGATVPETYNKEPLVLDAREIRGVKSNGMLASARELGLGDDHTGILEIDGQLNGLPEPGASFAEHFHLKGDAIIDIENKMFTHRPDCFGWLGIAREIEGIHGRRYKSPKWYNANPTFPKVETEALPLEVRNELPALVPRFTAIALRGAQVKPSPVWLRADLARAGIRSINNIVDYTNWYMLLTGQPLHAYDYDKVLALDPGAKHATLVIRHPKKGEKITLLSGKEVEPRKEAIMIATEKALLGIGGVMGGGDTEVDDTTSNIILEAASFDMYSIRRTAMEHGLFTDAVTRFTKGQSPLQNLAVMAKIVDEIRTFAHGKVASKIVDDNHVPKAMRERASVHLPVHTTADFINSRLGSNFSRQEIAKLLTNVEFDITITGDELSILAPFWRTDIEIPEDIVEEVGRLHGYTDLPHELPERSVQPVRIRRMDLLKDAIRHTLAAAGANEVQTYTFVPAKLLEDVGQAKQHAFALRNALSPELQHYRLSLTPGLLEKVHGNIKAGYSPHVLFEMNKIHIKGDLDCDGLPREYQTLALVYASKEPTAGAPYYQAKYYLEALLNELHIPYVIKPAEHAPQWEIGRQVFAPFEPARVAFVYVGAEEEFAGFVGEYHPRARKNLKLPDATAGFEIDLERMKKHQKRVSYRPLLKFPATDQDVCFRVKKEITYGEIEELVAASLHADEKLRVTIAPVDIYQREDDKTHKQITLRITLQHHGRTLTTDEVNQLLDTVVKKVAAKTGGERV
jgi:phenylalanyl-tRNA synthetase beta chain